jgi:hypothetical protein
MVAPEAGAKRQRIDAALPGRESLSVPFLTQQVSGGNDSRDQYRTD